MLAVALALLLGGLFIVGLRDAHQLTTSEVPVPLAGLPSAFAGLRVVQLTDIHHGPFIPLEQVQRAVDLANGLRPDVVVLTGDNVHRRSAYIAPCFRVLAGLHAPLGVYAVLGNHDHWHGAGLTREAMAAAGIVDLTNRSVPLHRHGQTLWLAGVDDLIAGYPDLPAALSGVPQSGRALLLSHEPDLNEQLADHRVLLMLSGHTHGGQVVLPLIGPPIIPTLYSGYGHKYASGLIVDGWKRVFVSRGIGTITPPIRLNCPAEVVALTLMPGP